MEGVGSSAETKPAPIYGSRDAFGLALLLSGIGVAWLAEWAAPRSEWAVDHVTWMPYFEPLLARLLTSAVALVVVVQVVRRWRIHAPSDDARAITAPVARTLVIGLALAVVAWACQSAHATLERMRATRIAGEWSARVDQVGGGPPLAALCVVDDDSWQAWRQPVGAQDELRWHRRCEVVWIADGEENTSCSERSWMTDDWSRELDALDVPSERGRWFQMTTTWSGGGDGELDERVARSDR